MPPQSNEHNSTLGKEDKSSGFVGALDYAVADLSDAPIRGGDILACGFGMTSAAWITAYICRNPMLSAPVMGQVTIGLMLVMVFIGGFLAARYSAKGIWGAVAAGGLSGLLNILIVGSILHDAAKNSSIVPVASIWVGGSILLNALVGGAGGLIGMFVPSANRAAVRWNVIFPALLACTTLMLIIAGGFVTGFSAGMAVPDWPQSYGYNMFLFPLSKMQSVDGKFYEHSHRLLGSLVGVTSLAVAIQITRVERRAWVKLLAWCIFGGVCIQGLMGGFRVTANSIPLATIHGIFAQVVFASMACLAAAGMKTPPIAEFQAPSDRFFSSTLLGSLIIQLTLGALVRQRVDVLVLVHIMMAAVVTLLAITCGFRALVLHGGIKPLKRIGIAIISVVGMQLLLGIMALVFRTPTGETRTAVSALWTTAHQANGAMLLVSCTLLWFWELRLLKPVHQVISPSPTPPNPAMQPA